ncbi:flavodoxin family protein [Eubacteriales bacterium OttesenSCG-928-A19]|nr:flavodoxin family protein [Eubacteriales bacterium OttesenSCG-928-A19]
MKAIGFVASPRKAGNTAWTVERILEGARAQGAETELLYASDLEITPCRGCLGCVKGDGCVIPDDMQRVYAALQDADALVLGAPIYMGQMSAQAKAFMDRLFAQITPRFSPRFKEENAGKKMVLVFTQGNPSTDRFQPYYDYTRHMFQTLEFDVRDMVVIPNTRSEAASERSELPATMRQVGASLYGS